MCIFDTQRISSTLHLVSKDHEGHEDRPLVQPPVNLLKIADSISSWYIDRAKEAAYYYLLSTDGSFLLYSGLLFLVDAVDLFSLNSDAAAVPMSDDASGPK